MSGFSIEGVPEAGLGDDGVGGGGCHSEGRVSYRAWYLQSVHCRRAPLKLASKVHALKSVPLKSQNPKPKFVDQACT